jgi:ArsR family transcriptional regulator
MPVDEEEANAYLARFAKALGHPTRLAILRLLFRRGTCICGEIVEELPLAQSTVSQHLKKLKDAGLIRGDVDGPRVCFCVEPTAIEMLKALIEELISTPSEG